MPVGLAPIAAAGGTALTLPTNTLRKVIPPPLGYEIMPVFCPTRVRYRCFGRVGQKGVSRIKLACERQGGSGWRLAGPYGSVGRGNPQKLWHGRHSFARCERQPMLFLLPWEGPSGIRCLAPLFALNPERRWRVRWQRYFPMSPKSLKTPA
jgi:hypothetical protein